MEIERATETHPPLWHKTKGLNVPTLTSNLKTDVCIVGAGISGLTTAYHLLKKGLRVVVIDRRDLNEGETGHTSAHLSNALDDGFQKIKSIYGIEGLKLAFESHSRAIDEIEHICRAEKISCDFSRLSGFLFLDPRTQISYLEKELEVIKEAGGIGVTLVTNTPSFDLGPALRFPDQAQFHPDKYLNGLALAVQKLGGLIFSQTSAHEIHGGLGAHVVTDSKHVIGAEDIVVATNVPVNNLFKSHTRLVAYRSYVVALEIPMGSVEPCLLWDTANPYHYIRTYHEPGSSHDLLIVGGADHRTGQEDHPDAHYEQLKNWAKKVLHVEPVVKSQWSGQIIEPVDSLALIGRNPYEENIYIVAGDSGHGLTHGTIAGLLLSDLITGQANKWAQLYNPARLSLNWRVDGAYLSENLNTAQQYLDWLSPGEDIYEEDVDVDEGAIIREGLRKIAVYRDEHNHLHRFSAECPHLKGLVRWNTSEKSWDCPCHGSRFDKFGKVLNGPALDNLTPISEVAVAPIPVLVTELNL